MTDVIIYKCKSCKKEFGPIGMHGYSPTDGSGELPASCKTCKTINVVKIEDKQIVNPDCPACNSPVTLFDGKCPSCNSRHMVFMDARLQGIEHKAPAVKL